MSIKTDLQMTIKETQVIIKNVKQQITARLNACPDNSHINRLGNNCFTIKSSQLTKHDNWTPFFHDHILQYKFIIDLIEKSSLETIINKIEGIIEKGSYKKSNYETVKFHPGIAFNRYLIFNMRLEVIRRE